MLGRHRTFGQKRKPTKKIRRKSQLVRPDQGKTVISAGGRGIGSMPIIGGESRLGKNLYGEEGTGSKVPARDVNRMQGTVGKVCGKKSTEKQPVHGKGDPVLRLGTKRETARCKALKQGY